MRKIYNTGRTDYRGMSIHAIDCGDCDRQITLGFRDRQCDCGAWYNPAGQRLRDDWWDRSTYAEYGEEW